MTRCVCEYSIEDSRVYVQQETSYLQQLALYSTGKVRLIVY